MRFLHGRRARRHHRRRHIALRRGGLLTLVAVLGPGLLAGLSDDDPAGITTYSILGADHGYALLWTLAASTALLILFHQLAARIGVVTGEGLLAVLRARRSPRAAHALLVPLLAANLGTLCAEFAGIAAAASLAGVPRGVAVPVAAVGVTTLVLGASFHRIEHVLLVLSSVFAAYVGAGLLAHPDGSATVKGLLVPTVPAGGDAALAIVACVGTTLAPWGLTFLQSCVADKRVAVQQLRYERIDVLVGAVLTGVIGAFVVVACAATLHPQGRSIEDAADAAAALRPLAGDLAGLLFGVGLLGAGLLAAAVVPLATAYSVAEALGHEGRLDDGPRQAPLFYGTYVASVALASAIVLIPAVPLVPVLFLTQALNAILLMPVLAQIRALARDPDVLGEHVIGPREHALTLAGMVAVGACVAGLVVAEIV